MMAKLFQGKLLSSQVLMGTLDTVNFELVLITTTEGTIFMAILLISAKNMVTIN